MKQSWTTGLDKDMKREVELSFKGSRVLRDRLKVLIEEKVSTSDKTSLRKDGYDCPNWSFKQADNVGYQRMAEEIISLLFENK